MIPGLIIVASCLHPSLCPAAPVDDRSLTRSEAEGAVERIWQEYADSVRAEHESALNDLILRHGDHEMRLLRREFGDRPERGHSLWISMHGGGNTAAERNDQQWRNQIRLYQPVEGIVVAPRAPTNTWNLWHREEIDRLFDRLIESAMIVWDVDPDRVFLLGYSAGGDGVYQVAPRMADRFAAASMMAGHPNDATPHGLRNLPFAIFMGGQDGAYNRNKVAESWGNQLAELRESDPDGYPHQVMIYPEVGHWMQGRDAEAIPWMSQFTRNPWPRRVVWRQGNVTHTRFHWLAVHSDDAKRGHMVVATVNEQVIEIETDHYSRIELLLHDDLLDLDRPVTVMANGQQVFSGRVDRTEEAVLRSFELRADPRAAATARLIVSWTRDEEEPNDHTQEAQSGSVDNTD